MLNREERRITAPGSEYSATDETDLSAAADGPGSL